MKTKGILPRVIFVLAVMAVAVAGCQHSPSQYIAPRVTGRVVDAQTQQPLADVLVQRLMGNHRPSPLETKGAEMLTLTPGERTREDGLFNLASERDLAFIRKLKWNSVTLTFSRSGYQKETRIFSATNAVTTPGGEPWINTGDVPLSR